MAEKQRTTYVILRYEKPTVRNDHFVGESYPVKAADTRREAREYVVRMSQRSKKYGYHFASVKHI